MELATHSLVWQGYCCWEITRWCLLYDVISRVCEGTQGMHMMQWWCQIWRQKTWKMGFLVTYNWSWIVSYLVYKKTYNLKCHEIQLSSFIFISKFVTDYLCNVLKYEYVSIYFIILWLFMYILYLCFKT